ncbi:GLPGLI family protein [Chryseobacterium paridis]|uniref:GLPGLI family protein n=1 Tax=Chryseobacterium paridis TaxID=2800328 RepID=A0ABS1FQW6_9FLAO|nr:GLPGLI family protein [Chryseobacterium paridis]MBK1894833.1 GLPGLI family protein [Chryseobacterium paridis]
MKTYACLFLLFSVLYSSQIQRFTYEYQYITDSTNRADVKKELMLLDIEEKGSKYYSYDVFVTDSILNSEFVKQGDKGNPIAFIKPGNYKGAIRSKVTKEYPDYKTYLHTNLSFDFYKVEEDQKPIWKIHPEKIKIGNYSSQKATTKYLGREWTAWFSTDLPFQDGPYKFYGLPGLIVKLEDKKQSHIMTLIANRTVKEVSDEMVFNKIKNEISVNNIQFNKLWKEYVNDPNKITRQKIASSEHDAQGNSTFNFVDASGHKLDANEEMRKNKERFKEALKKNNNRLDFDLYKY